MIATHATSLADILPLARREAPLIELARVNKVFRGDHVQTRALSNIQLAIERGEFVSITGPSGCGKSTLLAILGLLDAPSDGAYRIAGVDTVTLAATEHAALRNRSIGFVFQSFNLIGDLSVEVNVELPLLYAGMPTAERKQRVAAALDAVQCGHLARLMPGRLSGGQQQRIAVARAIAADPPILLADEPTGNLDSATGDVVMELICAAHARGTTVCLITHNPEYARLASRVVELFDGRLVGDRGR